MSAAEMSTPDQSTPGQSTAMRFTAPPFGLEPLRDFTLVAVDGSTGLFSLRPDGLPHTRLFLLDAAVHLPDYQPVLSDEQCASVDLSSPDEVSIYVVVNPSDGESTVNLMAPIVVNRHTGVAAQLILDDPTWPLKAPLASLVAH
jgi:flagellar assembly factor FliW